jgi:hypothetical protein
MLEMGGGQQHMHGVLIIIHHMWNPLHTNFPLPKVVGEDAKHMLVRFLLLQQVPYVKSCLWI